MTYLSDRQRKKAKLIKIISFIVPVLLLSLFWNPIKIFLTPPAFGTAAVLWNIKENIASSFAETKSYFTSRETFLKTIENLERENDQLLTEISILEEEIEVASLLIGTELPERGMIHIVYPIFNSLTTIYDSLLISAGFGDGIEKGMTVYAAGYRPIGIVEEVGSSVSRVSLLSKGGNQIHGVIRNRDITLELTGIGGGDFISYLPKEKITEIGDTVFWKDNPGMELGQIVEIENEPQSISQKIYIKGSYEISGNTRLYVNIR